MSDGVIYAGVGELLNFGWQWEDMAAYTLKCTKETLSASRLTAMLSQACYELYGEKPGDDTTIAVARVIPRRVVNIFTGPPLQKADDEQGDTRSDEAGGEEGSLRRYQCQYQRPAC